MAVELREGTEIDPDALRSLYESVGWTAYTRDPERLVAAVRNSSWVATAWDGDVLVGLVRVMTDDVSIFYLQDVLVRPTHHRRGIGRSLIQAALTRFRHVRQKVLLTDDHPAQHAFYEALGFVDTRGTTLHAFVNVETRASR